LEIALTGGKPLQIIGEKSERQAETPVIRYLFDAEKNMPSSTELLQDVVAIEEPMEIRVVFGPVGQRESTSLSITMRTPGDDFELAAGFLVSEGIVKETGAIRSMKFCGPVPEQRTTSNIVKVELAADLPFDLEKLQRHFYTTSSCGICGKASLDAVQNDGMVSVASSDSSIDQRLSADRIRQLPERLRSAQPLFATTGGLHASGLFEMSGDLLLVREDVGRHNALDKVVGRMLLDGHLPLQQHVLVVSGRASFELVQKAIAAGIPMLVAVGAPSSLAVDLAKRFDMTLIGFASQRRFNIYCGAQRVSDEISAE